jgi:hypothetical protein
VAKDIHFGQVSDEEAAPFVEQYCREHHSPFEGDPNYGLHVLWQGCYIDGDLHAVVGYVELGKAAYLHGIYRTDTTKGLRAMLLLEKFSYNLGMQLWGYIHITHTDMVKRRVKQGCLFHNTSGEYLLFSYP